MRETEKNDLSLSICVNRQYRKNCISAAPRRREDATASSLLGVQKGVSHGRSPIFLPHLPHPPNYSSFRPFHHDFANVLLCLSISMLSSVMALSCSPSPPTPCAATPLSPPSLLLQCRVMDAHGLYAYLLHAVSSYNLSARRRAGREMKLEED